MRIKRLLILSKVLIIFVSVEAYSERYSEKWLCVICQGGQLIAYSDPFDIVNDVHHVLAHTRAKQWNSMVCEMSSREFWDSLASLWKILYFKIVADSCFWGRKYEDHSILFYKVLTNAWI